MGDANLIFFLARRNVRRYWRRGLQCFLVLFAGAACVMLIDSFMRGFKAQAAERVVAQSGHADAYAPGYVESMDAFPLDLAIDRVDESMELMRSAAATEAAERGAPLEVLSAASIIAGALLSNGEESVPVVLAGIQAYAEGGVGNAPANPAATRALESMERGRYFASPLETGAVIDAKRAERLGLGPGDMAILICSDATGSFAMFETKVIGVARTDSLPMGAACVVDLGSLASALDMEGKATSASLWFARSGREGAELLPPEALPDAAAAAIRAAESAGLRGRPFAEISATSIAMFKFLDAFILGMLAIFVLVAGAGMANTILLSVQDRVRDMGTLRAIALTSRGTGLLVTLETLIIGFAASLAAFVAMSPLIMALERTGVGFVFNYASVSRDLPSEIRPIFEPLRSAFIALTGVLVSLVAAVMPIRKAMRLTVRESCMET